jgi:hypothetical protein
MKSIWSAFWTVIFFFSTLMLGASIARIVKDRS